MIGNDDEFKEHLRSLRRMFLLTAVTGLIASSIYAIGAGGFAAAVSIIAVCLLVGGAALLVGSLLGFLFGIPRTLQGADTGEDRGPNSSGTAAALSYRVNTNLEQISDWLTKILVGLGLTELGSVPRRLDSLGETLGPALGNTASSRVFGIVLVVFFCICGFFLGYLGTRLMLPALLRRADSGLLGAIRDAANTAELASLSTVETAMLAGLYQQPKGYQGVIWLAQQYMERSGEPVSPRFWVRLACAYGQQYAAERSEEARQGVLMAVRKVLAVDDQQHHQKALLRSLWDKNDPNFDPEDNDLESLANDDELKKLLSD